MLIIEQCWNLIGILLNLFMFHFSASLSQVSLWPGQILTYVNFFTEIFYNSLNLICALCFYSFQSHNLSTTGSSEHVSHQHGAFHRPAMNTSHTLGLLQLLKERGISALTQPSLPPRIRPSTSTLTAETNQGHRGAKQLRRNIFSFNLVEKLQSLGLYKVVARGYLDSGKTQGNPHNASTTKYWTPACSRATVLPFCIQQIELLIKCHVYNWTFKSHIHVEWSL